MASNTIGQTLFGTGASGLGGVGATGASGANSYGRVGHGSGAGYRRTSIQVWDWSVIGIWIDTTWFTIRNAPAEEHHEAGQIIFPTTSARRTIRIPRTRKIS